MTNILTYTVEEELLRIKELSAECVMSQLAIGSRKELDQLASDAVRLNFGRILELANVLDIDAEVVEQLRREKPGLLLPTEDVQQRDRLEIATNHTSDGKKVLIKPSMSFIKQSFLNTQVAYGSTYGIFSDGDTSRIKQETFGYAYRFGLGKMLIDAMQERVAPGANIIRKRDAKHGVAAFAGFFALYLSDPLKVDNIDYDYREEYIGTYPGWACRIAYEVLEEHQPNRLTEFHDRYVTGMIRPMNMDEVGETIAVAEKKRKPALRLV